MEIEFLQHGIGALGFDLDLLFTNLDKSYLFVIDYVLLICRLMLELLGTKYPDNIKTSR